jgi:CheY-like chemotaxis protein
MKRYVLIVDDEFGLADVLASLLDERGYDVAVVINGKLGLASLASRRADLVLVDLMMPVVDGPEMIRQLRADPALARLPVILMTALPEAVPAGGLHDAILVKPFGLDELLEVMARLLPPA